MRKFLFLVSSLVFVLSQSNNLVAQPLSEVVEKAKKEIEFLDGLDKAEIKKAKRLFDSLYFELRAIDALLSRIELETAPKNVVLESLTEGRVGSFGDHAELRSAISLN